MTNPRAADHLRSAHQTIGNVTVGDYSNVEIGLKLNNDFTTQEKCLQSLAFTDMRRRGDIASKARNTCDWIFEHPEYAAWSRDGGLLCLKGQAGSGKSTLMNEILTRALREPKADRVLSFFFHKRGHKLQFTPLGLYRSLLHQFLSRAPPLLQHFYEKSNFAERCRQEGETGGRWDWTESDLKVFLEDVFDQHNGEPLWLYIDAIDEAGDTEASRLMRWFDEIRTKSNRINLCVSCRPYPDVVWSPTHEVTIHEGNFDDIARFVDGALYVVAEFNNKPEVASELKRRAGGVFQWVVLVTPRVIEIRQQSTEEILSAIAIAPQQLDALYDDMLSHLHLDEATLALQCFRWVVFAIKPLTVEQLRCALSIDPNRPLERSKYEGSRFMRKDDAAMIAEIGRISRGLLVCLQKPGQNADPADEENRTWGVSVSTRARTVDLSFFVTFNHESVREYVVSHGLERLLTQSSPLATDAMQLGQIDYLLMQVCVRYLMAANWPSLAHPSDSAKTVDQSPPRFASGYWHRVQRRQTDSFFAYACPSWTEHAVRAEAARVNLSTLVEITEWPSNHMISYWSAVGEKHYDPRVTLQHTAARYGLRSILEDLNRRSPKRSTPPKKWDARSLATENGMGMNALNIALSSSHPGVFEFLLSTGQFDVDRKDLTRLTILRHAAESPRPDFIKLLLQKTEINPNAMAGGYHEHASHAWYTYSKKALRSGSLSYVAGAYPTAALHITAQSGPVENIALLLQAPGIDVNIRCAGRLTPLHFAVDSANWHQTKALLEHPRIKPNLQDSLGRTALHLAVGHLWKDGVVLLLGSKRVRLDVKSSFGRTPLQSAEEHYERLTSAPYKELNDTMAELMTGWSPGISRHERSIEQIERDIDDIRRLLRP